jgi:hypothetical protein
MGETFICTECGGKLCAHGHCAHCEPGACDECAEEKFAKKDDEDDQELGGES